MSTESTRRTRARRKKAGMCTMCGVRKKTKSTFTCARCRKKAKELARSIRERVFKHYGNECRHCKENDLKSLTLDHINNDGYMHKHKSGGYRLGGSGIYCWALRNDFPNSLQALCWNCNLTKQFNDGKLPGWRKNKYKEFK